MYSWSIVAILALCLTVVQSAGPVQQEDEVTEQHGPSAPQKEALREKQAHFIQRAKEIKEDESLSEEEKQKQLHQLREHAMLYMGPHAILPHALMQQSPIPAVEEKRRHLIRAVEAIATSDRDLDEKKRELESVRDQFKEEVNAIHQELSEEDIQKVRMSIRKHGEANAYKQMIHDGIRGSMEAGARGQAFNQAIHRGVQKLTAGLKNKEMGEYRKKMTGKRMANAGHKAEKRRAVRESRSQPDLF
ncbi:uncharacterized protein LOC129277626 [Lytechinus pictus]|uniref:uncharacterized protein LOC129277626 n=1 Tax=Lytechinus pictus TaxID=7653 RepID=UPI00240E293B|nr:uncharacterized protein LOC129277626 [Lytechinus pictus]